MLKIALYLQYISTRKIITIRELLLTAGLLFSYFNLLASSFYLNSVRYFRLSFYCCHPSEVLITSEDNTDIFSDHIMNAIAEIRNSNKRPGNKSIN